VVCRRCRRGQKLAQPLGRGATGVARGPIQRSLSYCSSPCSPWPSSSSFCRPLTSRVGHLIHRLRARGACPFTCTSSYGSFRSPSSSSCPRPRATSLSRCDACCLLRRSRSCTSCRRLRRTFGSCSSSRCYLSLSFSCCQGTRGSSASSCASYPAQERQLTRQPKPPRRKSPPVQTPPPHRALSADAICGRCRSSTRRPRPQPNASRAEMARFT